MIRNQYRRNIPWLIFSAYLHILPFCFARPRSCTLQQGTEILGSGNEIHGCVAVPLPISTSRLNQVSLGKRSQCLPEESLMLTSSVPVQPSATIAAWSYASKVRPNLSRMPKRPSIASCTFIPILSKISHVSKLSGASSSDRS